MMIWGTSALVTIWDLWLISSREKNQHLLNGPASWWTPPTKPWWLFGGVEYSEDGINVATWLAWFLWHSFLKLAQPHKCEKKCSFRVFLIGLPHDQWKVHFTWRVTGGLTLLLWPLHFRCAPTLNSPRFRYGRQTHLVLSRNVGDSHGFITNWAWWHKLPSTLSCG